MCNREYEPGMVSRDGLKTWFDYELLFFGAAIAGGILLLVGYTLDAWAAQWSIPVSRFALYIAAVCFGTLFVFVWLAGRLD